MMIGTVVGTLVAPVKHPFYEGRTILLVRYDRPEGGREGLSGPAARLAVAVDRAQAGVGDKVLVLKEGSSARDLFEQPEAPVRTVVVGVIDEVEMTGRRVWPGMTGRSDPDGKYDR